MATMISNYNAAPSAERWNRTNERELRELIAECKERASDETDAISLDSLNATIEEALSVIEAIGHGSNAWIAQDEDGYYFAHGKSRFDQSSSNAIDGECAAKEEWYDAHPDFDASIDAIEEKIALAFDAAGLRLSGGFDSLASVEDFKRAALRALRAWAASLVA